MRKNLARVVVCVLAAMLLGTTAFAHATMSEFYPNPGSSEGVIRFFFDDDEFMSNVEVTVYDTFGTQIAAGVTDAHGHFDFSGLGDVGHVIARYDAEHIQIHVVAEGGGYIIGKGFGGTYVSYSQLNELLRSFVLARWWLGIYVLAIPGAIFAVALIFFIIASRKGVKA